MSLFDRLFRPGVEESGRQRRERIDAAAERVLAINPRLRLAERYGERLAGAVTIAADYVDNLVRSLPAPHEANEKAWSSDPCIRAFFATPSDIPRALSRSVELRAHFDHHPGSEHAHAVLGMALTMRHVLGVALEGETMRNDVAQTTLCFSDHRTRMCGNTEETLREEIGRRLIDQLALAGLEMLATDRRKLVEKGRELLEERLALLQRNGSGVGAIVGLKPSDDASELARVETSIQENASRLAALRVPTDLLELELGRVCAVLSDPPSHLYVTKKQVSIDHMNVVQDKETPRSHRIEFDVAHLPGDPPRMRAFALVRCSRGDLLPAGLNYDAAMRAL
ncbi:hypothetical protein [Paraburkholderia kirstenboschensis]|uniref:Uncharacterized protein n=1 Tax=Paraburkholderia kirstenboschensis TaxID=1245436 RepID=A0ABZ0EED1_9BURK|nr:hypothetical protein [Paraburkholderia kirstenboschensis]WOD15583.1 hypothetical protein RW095_20135 [Paraburkholderia kirstenboschensis]